MKRIFIQQVAKEFWFILAVLLTGISTGFAAVNPAVLKTSIQNGECSPGLKFENIASGKPYTLSRNPNYALCRDDENDAAYLTDGLITLDRYDETGITGDRYWAQKTTVGWVGSGNVISITVDLGKVEPIRGFALRTAAGQAEVFWANSIAVLVSEDGENFYYAADLIREGRDDLPPAYGVSRPHWFWTDGVRTKGRHVAFVVVPHQSYFFTDEIEIYRGDEGYLDEPYSGEPVDEEYVIDRNRLTRLGVYRRMRRDLEEISSVAEKDGLILELQRLRERMEREEDFPRDWESFKAVVPFNGLHGEIFGVYGRSLAAAGKPEMSVWKSGPYGFVPLLSEPGEEISGLNIKMMRNERRPAAFNLTNASGTEEPFRFRITGLPGGLNPGYVHVYQVEYVDTAQGIAIPGALVRLEEEGGYYRSRVPAGMTRQIWLQVDSGGLEAGSHDGYVNIEGERIVRDIALKVDIYPFLMTGRREMACSLGLWDYIWNTARGITADNKQAAKEDIYDHVVDTVWAFGGTMRDIHDRSGKNFDSEGNLVGEIDFARWNSFVGEWPGMKYYVLFAAIPRVDMVRFARFQQGTAEFDNAIAQWGAAWAKHNREVLGLEPGQAAILWMDEPSASIHLKGAYYLSRALKKGTDEITAFTTILGGAVTRDYGKELIEMSDIVCPQPLHVMGLEEEYRDYYRNLGEKGVELAFYQCVANRHLHTAYFRMQPWHALDYGAGGSHFWAYACMGTTSSWNEYWGVGSKSFPPAYVTPEGITNSKQWEAVRAGVLDYEYVEILKSRIAGLRASGSRNRYLDGAEELTESIGGSVIEKTHHRYGQHYYGIPHSVIYLEVDEFAEEARIQILQMLEKLK